MKTFKTIGAILVIALIAAACGGGSDEDDALIEAIAAQFEEDPPPEDFDFDSNCMAKAIVNELGGAKEIEEKFGVTAEGIADGQEADDLGLSEDQANGVVDKMWGCGDFSQLMFFGLAESMSDDDASCMTDEIGEDLIKQLVASSFMGDAGEALGAEAGEEFFEKAFGAAAACGVDFS